MVRFFAARSMAEVLQHLKRLPRLKKRSTLGGMHSIEEISREEYLRGQADRPKDAYLSTRR
jgi:hypothetical protein